MSAKGKIIYLSDAYYIFYMTEDKKGILEAALFMAKDPIMLNDLGKIANIGSAGYVKKLLEELRNDYSKKGIEISQLPGGWQMQVKTEHLPKVAHLTPYSDIKEGCKRTLALVVYKEPIKQSDIIKIQGNKAYLYIKILHKKGLVNSEKSGRTKILKGTKELENYFGMSKKEIRERIDAGLKGYEEKIDKELEEPEKEEIEAKTPKKGKSFKKPKKKLKTSKPKRSTAKMKKGKKSNKKAKKEMKDIVIDKNTIDSLRELSIDDFEKEK